MPEKKKHHYVPRFLLKYFSLSNEGKTIGIFNLPQELFINSGGLKGQAYRDYLYGKDGHIENSFGLLEGVNSTIISQIQKTITLPAYTSNDQLLLYSFIVLLRARTLYSIDEKREIADKMDDYVTTTKPSNIIKGSKKSPLQTDPAKFSISMAAAMIPIILDLRYKLLINHTAVPFLLSDNPVILYNQYLETRHKVGSIAAWGSKGLEVFLPISPKFTLMLFDQGIYKVGERKSKTISLTSENDVHELNALQVLNAYENLYFNEQFSEILTRDYWKRLKKKRRRTKTNLKRTRNLVNRETGSRSIVHMYFSDLKIRFNPSFLSLTKGAKRRELNNDAVHVRNRDIISKTPRFTSMAKNIGITPNEILDWLRTWKSQI